MLRVVGRCVVQPVSVQANIEKQIPSRRRAEPGLRPDGEPEVWPSTVSC